ncbi:MAG: kelch repeat-containing protein [Cryomorphaceae bacterium]
MIRSLFFLVLCLAWHKSHAQVEIDPSEWSVETYYPGGRIDDGAAFQLNGHLYMGTGIDQSYQLRNDWWRYDLATKAWSPVSTLPGKGRQYATAFSSDRFGYLMGGILMGDSFTNACFRYDALRDQWNSLAQPPWSPRGAMAKFKVGNTLYLFGGRDGTEHFLDVWAFDLKTENWSHEGELPFEMGRDEMIAFGCSQYGYLLMGRSSTESYSDMWRYDIIHRVWKRLPDFPGNAVSYASAVRARSGAVVAGGQDEQGYLLSECFYFDCGEEKFEALPNLAVGEVRGMDLASIGDSVYSFGGLTHNFTRLDQVQLLELNGTEEFDQVPEVKLIGHPARSEVRLIWDLGAHYTIHYRLFTTQGLFVTSGRLPAPAGYSVIGLEEVNPGIYLLSLTANGTTVVEKLVVAN